MTETLPRRERALLANTAKHLFAMRRFAPAFAMGWAAVYFIAAWLLVPLAVGGARHGIWTYAAAQAQLTWFNTGFARRELQGTIQALFGGEPMFATAMFHLASYTALAAALIWLVARRRLSLALGAVAVAVLGRTGADVGRSDIAVMLCGLLAVWAARGGRWPLLATSLSIALALHESGFIVLGPLVAVAALESGSWRRWRSPAAAMGAMILAAGFAAYLVSATAHPDVPRLAREIHSQFIETQWADQAVYYSTSGARNLATAMCLTRVDQGYWVKILAGAALLALLSPSLRPKRWRMTLLATLPPFLGLSMIAFDLGRWAVFGAFGVLALALNDPEDSVDPGWTRGAAGLLAALLMLVSMDVKAVFGPIPLVDHALQLVIQQPSIAIEQCDPDWRRAIGLS